MHYTPSNTLTTNNPVSNNIIYSNPFNNDTTHNPAINNTINHNPNNTSNNIINNPTNNYDIFNNTINNPTHNYVINDNPTNYYAINNYTTFDSTINNTANYNAFDNNPTNIYTTISNINNNPTSSNVIHNPASIIAVNNSSNHNITSNFNFSRLNNSETSLASKLNVLNIKSLFSSTIANDFFNNKDFLHVIDHRYNTRRQAEGRFKVDRFTNEYGRNSLSVTLPTIMNKIPINIINTKNEYRRKKLIKNFFLGSQ